ncbi:MAG: glycosyltransferase family 9 protein [Kiritimatiellia bacterium]
MTRTRILILRGGAIGDFILTLPALTAVRRQWPEAYIELAGYPHIARLALAGGLADRITSLDKADMAQYYSLKATISPESREYIQSFNLIVSYLYDPDETVRNNLKSAGARRVVYADPRVKAGHAADRLFEPLEELAVYPEGTPVPELNLGKEHINNGMRLIAPGGERIAALHPGSGGQAKQWELKHFITLATAIRENYALEPVFILGEAEQEFKTTLAVAAPRYRVLSGISLVELAEALSACACCAGNDSGVTHLAASLGIPTLALFGPTDPAMWGPRGEKVRVVKKGDSMSDIGVEDALEALESIV